MLMKLGFAPVKGKCLSNFLKMKKLRLLLVKPFQLNPIRSKNDLLSCYLNWMNQIGKCLKK